MTLAAWLIALALVQDPPDVGPNAADEPIAKAFSLKCGWPPMESDDYFGATIALLATGRAPENYAATPAAQEGVKKIREYLAKNSAPSLHHKGMLFWASKHVEGIMSAEEQKKTVDE